VTEVWQRPLRSDAERNRRLVLEAAARRSPRRASTSAWRRSRAVPASATRRSSAAFPTKDALYEAIVDEKIAELVTAGRRGELPDPWDALVRYLETMAELQARDRGFFQATEQHLFEHPELLRRHRDILDVIERWSSALSRPASCATT
jgi:AcrR family transcriptional regulator